MPKAMFNDTVIAESDNTVMVEGNHYFPRHSVRMEFFTPTDHTTVCPWKGTATYFTVDAAGESKANAAWTYEEPLEKATHIQGHVAFYPSVSVTE